MTCSQPESITIAASGVCPQLRTSIALGSGGQMTGIDLRNQVWAAQGNGQLVRVINTNINTVIHTIVIGPLEADGLCYVPPKKGLLTTFNLDPFTVPALNNNVVVHLNDTSGLTQNKYVFFDGPATFKVVSIGDPTHATLQFVGFSGDVAPGTTINANTNLYNTKTRTDLIYFTASFPTGFYSIDPDTYAMTLISNPSGNSGPIFYASVSNCVCIASGSTFYSYDINTGTITSSSPGGGGLALCYSPAHDLIYAYYSDPSTLFAGIISLLPTTMAIVAMAPFANNCAFGAYCPTNDSLYLSNTEIVPLMPTKWHVDVFNASNLAHVTQFTFPDPITPAGTVGGVAFNLTEGIIIAGLYAQVVVISTTNNVICFVGTSPPPANLIARTMYYNASTGSVYVASINGFDFTGAIDSFA